MNRYGFVGGSNSREGGAIENAHKVSNVRPDHDGNDGFNEAETVGSVYGETWPMTA